MHYNPHSIKISEWGLETKYKKNIDHPTILVCEDITPHEMCRFWVEKPI